MLLRLQVIMLLWLCASLGAVESATIPPKQGILENGRSDLTWSERFIEVVSVGNEPQQIVHFRVKNEGQQLHAIHGVELCCGVQLATKLPLQIAPGKVESLDFIVPVGTHTQSFSGAVTVDADDQARPFVVLTMTIIIPRIARMSPPMLLWNVGAEAAQKTLRIEMMLGKTLDIEGIRQDPLCMDIRIERIDQGSQYVVRAAPLNPGKAIDTVIQIPVSTGEVVRIPVRVLATGEERQTMSKPRVKPEGMAPRQTP